MSSTQDGRPEVCQAVDLSAGPPGGDPADVPTRTPIARPRSARQTARIPVERSVAPAAPSHATPAPADPSSDAGELWLGPLTDTRCRDTRFTGRDVAALAGVADLWTVPASQVATAPVSTWAARRADLDILAEASARGAVLHNPVSVRGWLAADRECLALRPVWYNLDPATIQETVIELVALAARTAGSAGWHRLVIALQDFMPPEASVTVGVDRRAERVELLACWGLDEDLGAGVWRDTLVLRGPQLDVERHEVVHKPTATVAARGGTRIEPVEPRLRGGAALSAPAGRAIARLALSTAERLAADLRLDVALRGEQTHLLACHLT